MEDNKKPRGKCTPSVCVCPTLTAAAKQSISQRTAPSIKRRKGAKWHRGEQDSKEESMDCCDSRSPRQQKNACLPSNHTEQRSKGMRVRLKFSRAKNSTSQKGKLSSVCQILVVAVHCSLVWVLWFNRNDGRLCAAVHGFVKPPNLVLALDELKKTMVCVCVCVCVRVWVCVCVQSTGLAWL